MSTEHQNSDSVTQQRSQQNLHHISANNGSYLFAGNVSHVSLPHCEKATPSSEDIIKKCRDALFVSHPDVDRAGIAEAKGQRAPRTCEWIQENPQYQEWLEKKTPLFWISGGSGTGKTVMSLFLSEQVEKVCQGTGDHFLFYFCRFQHDCYNKPGNLLRSLSYQLLSFSTDVSAVLEVFGYLDTEEKAKNALSSLECLWKILEILLSQADLSTVYCIVDGVDELAIRPLTLRELAYAVGSGIDCMADRIAICQPLLKLDDDRVLFFHQSAREYLLRDQTDEDPTAELFRVEASKCHGEAAHKCLQILESSFLQNATLRFSESYFEEIEKGHLIQRDQLPAALRGEPELFNYAYLYWMKHTRLSSKDAQYLFDFSRPFFKKSSQIRRNWARSNGNIAQGRLNMASFYGIMPWLQAIQEEGDSITFHGTRRWKKWANSTGYSSTPLGYAIQGDCQEAVRFLLDYGADAEGEFSALWKATSLGRDKIVQILLENGAQITDSSCDRSVLITAAREGSINVVQLLLNHGADVNIRNDQNETPLIIAARISHESLVLFLLGRGAHLDVADFRVWLHQMAVIRWSRWSRGVVYIILRHVTNIRWAGDDGGRLLNLAVEWTDHEIVQLYLAKGADIDWKHPNGGTALVEAIMKDRSRSPSLVVTFLLPHNGGVMTKMQLGMIANKRAMVAFLLDHGADLNLGSEFRNGSLRPPLVVAAGEGLDWAVEELIKYGVDCNA
ncbi:hypothetical protein FPRO03_13234 [Fusarium proliferatum]|nr:hypothetical protein FPRO03_13234 [Fusarium proliferatum]